MLRLVVSVLLFLSAVTNEQSGSSNNTHIRNPSILVKAETQDKIYACAPCVLVRQLIKTFKKQSEDQRNSLRV